MRVNDTETHSMGTGTSNSRKVEKPKKVSKDKEELKIKRDQDIKELKGSGSSSCQNDVMISYSHADTDWMKKIKGRHIRIHKEQVCILYCIPYNFVCF